MNVSYSELIDKFQEQLGTPKYLIEETYNKPDATDIVKDKMVSIKRFGEFYILVVFEMDDKIVRFLNAYRIYPKLLDGFEISKMKPLEVLKEFMNKYGISKQLSGFGECKIFIDKSVNVYFLGILDIDRYLADVKNL